MVDVSPPRSANEPLFTVSHAKIDSSTCTTLLEYLQRAAIGAICYSPDHGSFKKVDGNDSWWSCDFASTCSLEELREMLFGLIERRGSNQTLNSKEIIMTKRCKTMVKTEGGDDDYLFGAEEVQESPDKAYLDTTGNISNAAEEEGLLAKTLAASRCESSTAPNSPAAPAGVVLKRVKCSDLMTNSFNGSCPEGYELYGGGLFAETELAARLTMLDGTVLAPLEKREAGQPLQLWQLQENCWSSEQADSCMALVIPLREQPGLTDGKRVYVPHEDTMNQRGWT